jgi:cardiolipin synthase
MTDPLAASPRPDATVLPRTPGLALRRLQAPLRAWAAARVLDAGVRDVAFRSLVQRIDDAPLHAAPPVHLLPDGAQAFARMLEAMASAREEILLETYIMRDDRLGASVQAALATAAQRGVRVYVLADAVGSIATADRFWNLLEKSGVQVRHFHNFWHHPFEALRRDHRKLLVIDRTIGFTGGMNIGEEYGSSIRQRHDAWRDTFVELHGSVARELAAVFAEGWDRARGAPLPGLEYVSWSEGIVRPAGARPFGARALQTVVKRTMAKRRRGRRVRRESAAPLPPDDAQATAFVIDPRPGRGQREMLSVLAALVGGARERIWITTPYFAPPTQALRLLVLAAQRGIDVRLLLPSARTDVALVRHAAHGTYGTLLRAGVQLFEYQRATLHAKTLVVDGHASLIGSSNLDFRSFWLNAECNLLCFDDASAQALEHSFTHDLHASNEVTLQHWTGRSLGHRLLDVAARACRWAL